MAGKFRIRDLVSFKPGKFPISNSFGGGRSARHLRRAATSGPFSVRSQFTNGTLEISRGREAWIAHPDDLELTMAGAERGPTNSFGWPDKFKPRNIIGLSHYRSEYGGNAQVGDTVELPINLGQGETSKWVIVSDEEYNQQEGMKTESKSDLEQLVSALLDEPSEGQSESMKLDWNYYTWNSLTGRL